MNKARVLSDEFQAAEIELKELCNATFIMGSLIYEKFDLYENSAETKKLRKRL